MTKRGMDTWEIEPLGFTKYTGYVAPKCLDCGASLKHIEKRHRYVFNPLTEKNMLQEYQNDAGEFEEELGEFSFHCIKCGAELNVGIMGVLWFIRDEKNPASKLEGNFTVDGEVK